MLSVTRHTDYAVRIVLHLSALPEGRLLSIAEIALSRALPVPFVRRIVSLLAEEGVLRTVRGPGGGVALARPSSEITMLDVVTAMEGPLCPSPCIEKPAGCPFGKNCPARGVWTEAARVLENHLRSVRFSELAEAPGHRRAHAPAGAARSTRSRRITNSP